MLIRYDITYGTLKKHPFSLSSFPKAFSTYLHELTHVFSGEQRAGFSYALTILLQYLSGKPLLLDLYRKKWDKLLEGELILETSLVYQYSYWGSTMERPHFYGAFPSLSAS